MVAVNLGIRFLAELAGIAALAVWGYATPAANPWKIILAVLAPAVLVVVWGAWIAPKSNSPLPQRTRMIVGSALLLVTAALLGLAGHGLSAVVFAVIIVVNTAALASRPDGTNVG